MSIFAKGKVRHIRKISVQVVQCVEFLQSLKIDILKNSRFKNFDTLPQIVNKRLFQKIKMVVLLAPILEIAQKWSRISIFSNNRDFDQHFRVFSKTNINT